MGNIKYTSSKSLLEQIGEDFGFPIVSASNDDDWERVG